jgi:hypothetical protein
MTSKKLTKIMKKKNTQIINKGYNKKTDYQKKILVYFCKQNLNFTHTAIMCILRMFDSVLTRQHIVAFFHLH